MTQTSLQSQLLYEQVGEWEIQDVPLSQILPHPLNTKTHPPEQMEALAQSLGEFGNLSVGIWNRRTKHLIDAHGRLELFASQGKTSMACRVVDWSETQESRALLAFDRIGDLAVPDMDHLNALLSSLPDIDTGLLGALYTQDAIADLQARFDKSLELPILDEESERERDEQDAEFEENPPVLPTRSKMGELWALGDHRLFVGDCLEESNLQKLLEGQTVDLVFTDPPYALDWGPSFDTIRDKNGNKTKPRPIEKKMTDAEIDTFDPTAFLSVLPTLFKSDSVSAFVFCNLHLLETYLRWGREQKIPVRVLVWSKGNPIPIGGCHHSDIEFLLYFARHALWHPVGTDGEAHEAHRGRVLDFPRRSVEDSGHATPKPVLLIENQLILTTDKQGLVLDLYGGGGTTLIACEKQGRICYTCEHNPQFVNLILARWEAFTGQTATLLLS